MIRGELLVIPIEASLLYVQPLYLQASGGKIPELKRVIVAHEGRVVMDETFERALQVMFGGGTVLCVGVAAATASGSNAARPAETAAESRAALTAEAVQHYDAARAAQRADDWATYGREMQRLGEVLKRLRDAGPPK